ncbi:Rubisco activation protein CbbO [Enterovibrio sp. ZSDZ35]|uniref:Rubisco activation protein CbbO n=1 Tax=Enterovibrio qingdaonensis TaxID=2899818 RepID=A0ABT5QIA5_9GAMM|nr:VWA domain-containing protein [Enterovibrio sp. ZSDZ35]MDD1780715.1 Rubisco activation protein CbbO [Enterovibrio sp. ZSDZ35]
MDTKQRTQLKRIEHQVALRSDELKHAVQVGLLESEPLMQGQELDDYLSYISESLSSKQSDKSLAAFILMVPAVHIHIYDDVTRLITSSIKNLLEWMGTERLCQFLNSLPMVAERLRTRESLIIYLETVEFLASTAPRCLNLFFLRADKCLASVNIRGLRYWAFIGAKSHAHDNAALNAYFSLASTESQTIFQHQRPGVLLIDVQRHLQFYLRAIWDQDFFIRPRLTHAHGEKEDAEAHQFMQSPTIKGMTIFLPDALDHLQTGHKTIDAKTCYRAAAAHCAAQLKFGHRRSPSGFTDFQRFCVELIEDARIEFLAVADFKGLQNLWLPLLSNQGKLASSSFECFLQKLAITLLKPETRCTDNPIIVECQNRFSQLILLPKSFEQKRSVESLGCWLATSIKNNFEIGDTVTLQITDIFTYRDDNQFMWVDEVDEFDEWISTMDEQTLRTVNVMEMVNEIDCELADDDAQEIWRLESEFFRDGDPENISLNTLEGRHQISAPFYYSEWDYTANSYKPNWVTLTERSVTKSSHHDLESLIAKRKTLQRKLRAMIEALQPKGLIRLRKQYEGDSLDLDAAIDAIKEIRRGALPDMNIDQRLIRQDRSLSVLVLLDLSQSTLDTISGRDDDLSILDVAKEATAILAGAVDEIGDPFAIHGFSSNGRSDVQYHRVKDFEDDYDNDAKARLIGLKAGLSTRMGPALRHAKTFLSQQPQRKKLLLLVSDGEPSDVDVRDPQYLHADTKKAVDELNTEGIIPFCLTIDPDADAYVSQVFGKGHFSVLESVERLPEILPSLFASLTRGAH